MTTKNNFIFTLMLLTPLCVQSQLSALSKWDEEKKNWQSDVSEVAYVATRCASNFDIVGHYFIDRGINAKQKADGEAFKGFADRFMSIGYKTSKLTNMDNKAILERYQSFLEINTKLASENKKLHNNIFMGMFLQDFEFCQNNYQYFKGLDEKVK
jgi:hypothetical protein